MAEVSTSSIIKVGYLAFGSYRTFGYLVFIFYTYYKWYIWHTYILESEWSNEANGFKIIFNFSGRNAGVNI